MTTTPTAWNELSQVAAGGGGDFDANIVALADGGYLVSWTDESTVNAERIAGQRYDVLGHKVGGEIDLSHRTANNSDSDLALLANDRVAVAFVNLEGMTEQVIVHRFDAALQSFTTDIIGDGFDPSIAAFADGGYVIAKTVDNGPNVGVSYRTVSATGQVGTEKTAATGNDAHVAVLSNGDFVLAYAQSVNPMTNDYDVYFQVRERNGNLVASNAPLAGGGGDGVRQDDPAVGALKNGGFVMAWDDDAGDASGGGIRATIYNNGGHAISALATDFLVNTTQAGNQQGAIVTPLSDGTFIISWADVEGQVTRGQRFSAAGDTIGEEFTVDGQQETDDVSHAVELRDGRVAYGLGDHDGPDFMIQTQILDPRTGPITGTHKSDQLTGRVEGSVVKGLRGDDTLYGSTHADQLVGGKGADAMFAGDDNAKDVFVYAGRHESGHGKHSSGWDHIYNFDAHAKHEKTWDRIDFSAIDADRHGKHDQDFRFVDAFSKAHGKEPDGEITLEAGKHGVKVLVDVNGDKDADMIIVVMNVHHLHQSDFVL